jgi:hypothetical protein
MASTDERPLEDLAGRLKDEAQAESVSAGRMMKAAGRASYAPLLLLLAFVTITPIGSIPGVSIATGIVLLLLGGQMLAGRDRPWIPAWIERRSVKGNRVRKGLEKSDGLIRWFDRLPRPRLRRFTEGGWPRAVAAGVIVMGLLMFPLAFVPWGVLAPAVALLIVSLGLMGDDGLLTALGLAAMAVATGVSLYLVWTTFLGSG